MAAHLPQYQIKSQHSNSQGCWERASDKFVVKVHHKVGKASAWPHMQRLVQQLLDSQQSSHLCCSRKGSSVAMATMLQHPSPCGSATCKRAAGQHRKSLMRHLSVHPRHQSVFCKAMGADETAHRRTVLMAPGLATGLLLFNGIITENANAELSGYEPMDPLKGKDYGKPRQKYKDFTETASGLQYLDLVQGTGNQPAEGDTVVIDWDGYTIGYYGRVFESRNTPKGSSFYKDDREYYSFKLGAHTVIPAIEEAVTTMKVGGYRRIIVPIEISYPESNWRKLGPKPTTFAGDRTLDFVMSNKGMIDKTLLFDIELKNVIKG